MNQKIYIEYKISGVLANAYSVVLGSQDGTFGVKKQDGTVVVPHGTTVDSSLTGVYEYDLPVDFNTLYVASWKIVPVSGDTPVYVNQSIGPFSPTASLIKSVPDFRGTFIQGTTGALFLSLTDIHGNPLMAESLLLTISKDSVNVIEDVKPDFVKPGFYTFDWSIPNDLDVGKYLATWTYVVDNSTGVELQEFIVSSSGDSSNANIQLYGSRLSDFRVALSEMICCAQKIPVYHEQAIPNITNTIFKLTFSKWNQAFGTRVFRNNKIIESDYKINYFRGTILFDTPLSSYDMLHVDYNFRWFSDEQLDRFISNALSIVNFYPPTSKYDVLNIPESFVPLVLYGASKDAIRELLMCLNFQQPQQVFGGSEGASKAFSQLETLKKNYEDEFTRLLEQKKYGRYPRTRSIVTPEFTLPGGRSRWFNAMFKGGV